VDRYLVLMKEMRKNRSKPMSERTRSTQDYMDEMDRIYMGELTVPDREKLRHLLGEREP